MDESLAVLTGGADEPEKEEEDDEVDDVAMGEAVALGCRLMMIVVLLRRRSCMCS